MILYWSFLVEAKKESKLAKAQGGKVRVLHAEHSAAHDAKNRHGLPAVIRLGDTPEKAYAAFRSAFPRRPASGDAGTRGRGDAATENASSVAASPRLPVAASQDAASPRPSQPA